MLSISLTDPGRIPALLDALAAGAAEAVSVAPPDVAAATSLLSGLVAEYRTAFQAVDYRLAKLPPALVFKLQAPPVQEAMTRLERIAERAC